MMNNAETPAVRFPAEWEPQQAVIIAWPHAQTDWQPRLEEVTECYVAISTAISRHVTQLVILTAEPEVVKAQLTGKDDL